MTALDNYSWQLQSGHVHTCGGALLARVATSLLTHPCTFFLPHTSPLLCNYQIVSHKLPPLKRRSPGERSWLTSTRVVTLDPWHESPPCPYFWCHTQCFTPRKIQLQALRNALVPISCHPILTPKRILNSPLHPSATSSQHSPKMN